MTPGTDVLSSHSVCVVGWRLDSARLRIGVRTECGRDAPPGWWQAVTVFMLTIRPKGVGDGFREYDSRGWTTFERCSAELIKPVEAYVVPDGGMPPEWRPMALGFAPDGSRVALDGSRTAPDGSRMAH